MTDDHDAASLAHGGSLAEVRRCYPHAPQPWLDLSTGINPLPYAIPSLPAEAFTRLPEPADEQALRSVAARAYGVRDPDLIAAAPGTQILIGLLPALRPARSVAVVGPTYLEHARAWTLAGAQVQTVNRLEDLDDAEVVVLCNPNNPDGRRLEPQRLRHTADCLATHGGMLIVDEAFADLEPAPVSIVCALPHPALIVLRSFGKTYGLAGVRLGFALASANVTARLRALLGPWAVSGPALAVAQVALQDAAWRVSMAQRLEASTRALDSLLMEAGMRVLGGTRLFRLAASPDAAVIASRLAAAGIHVRRFAEQPEWLRFGQCGEKSDLQRLRKALMDSPAR